MAYFLNLMNQPPKLKYTSMKFKTLIIDGDSAARASLEATLQKLDKVNIVHTCSNVEEAKAFIKESPLDLIFLDVAEIGDLERPFLEALSSPPQVVLTTANESLEIDSLDRELSDVILKPYSLPQLSLTLHKVMETQAAMSEVAYASDAKEIYVKENGRLVRIPLDDIFYFENAGDYVKVITSKRSHIISGALKNIASRLKSPRLLKIHRSFIVHLSKIVDIEDHSIELENGKVIPISRSHKPKLIQSLNII